MQDYKIVDIFGVSYVEIVKDSYHLYFSLSKDLGVSKTARRLLTRHSQAKVVNRNVSGESELAVWECPEVVRYNLNEFPNHWVRVANSRKSYSTSLGYSLLLKGARVSKRSTYVCYNETLNQTYGLKGTTAFIGFFNFTERDKWCAEKTDCSLAFLDEIKKTALGKGLLAYTKDYFVLDTSMEYTQLKLLAIMCRNFQEFHLGHIFDRLVELGYVGKKALATTLSLSARSHRSGHGVFGKYDDQHAACALAGKTSIDQLYNGNFFLEDCVANDLPDGYQRKYMRLLFESEKDASNSIRAHGALVDALGNENTSVRASDMSDGFLRKMVEAFSNYYNLED